MLVPVQYQRIMELPEFDRYDLSVVPHEVRHQRALPAALKREVLDRWPGGLVEYYGMTEGGGTCVLHAHEYPDKLHTVGRPAPGHDIRLIDDDGREVPRGRRPAKWSAARRAMMTGYHNQPEQDAPKPSGTTPTASASSAPATSAASIRTAS